MAKTTKPKLVETPKLNDDEVIDRIEGAFDPADDADENYNDERDADNADRDYLPYEEEESAKVEAANPLDSDSLLRPEEVRYLKDSAERMRRPLSFMKWDDHGNYAIGEKDVSGSKVLAIIDLLVVQRTLFVAGKGVEAHGHFMKGLKGKAPPRPPTFEDRSRWEEHHKQRKNFDPWGNISQILALQSASGGIISLQTNSAATKAAFGELLAAFIERGAKQRPIVELSFDTNPETGERFSLLRIIDWKTTNEDFSYLREMLLRDDPEFPEPPKPKPFDAY